MGASGPPNTRTSATACVYGLQLRGSLFGQVHIPTGVDRGNLGTSPPAGLRTLTVVAQEQKAVLAKLFNHSEKQTNAQVGHFWQCPGRTACHWILAILVGQTLGLRGSLGPALRRAKLAAQDWRWRPAEQPCRRATWHFRANRGTAGA